MPETYALLIGGGPSQEGLVKPLRERSLGLIVVAKDEPVFGVQQHLELSTHSTDDVVAAVKEVARTADIQVVASRTSGPAARTLAAVAESLNLPGPGTLLGRAAASKWALHETALKLGIPTIPTAIAHAIALAPARLTYPLVVKPNVGIVGKQGVTLVRMREHLGEAIRQAEDASFDGLAVFQPVIVGQDLNYHILARRGKIIWGVVTGENNLFSKSGHIESAQQAWVPRRTQEQALRLFQASVPALVKHSGLTGHAVFSFRADLSKCSALWYETNVGPPGDRITEDFFPHMSHDAFEAEISALWAAREA